MDRLVGCPVGLFGITLELNLDDGDLSSIASDFVPSVMRLLDTLPDRRAVLLILDDINGLAVSEVFAHWLKSTVDEIATSRIETPLCMLVVGLEERRQELVTSQPSLARVFELTDIMPWSADDTKEFYRHAFESAQARISGEHLDFLVQYTGGLPVLAHEVGDAVWRSARSPEIDERTVLEGVLSAAEVIGRKLLEPQVFSAIRGERYRSIMKKMSSDTSTMHVRRSELAARLSPSERGVMDNFLRRMKKLGALEADPNVRGGYKFPNRLHALYFWMESRRP